MARQAADGIRQNLKPAAASVAATAGATASSEAELALREGTYFLNKYNNRHESAHFDLALSALQRAIRLDPKLADAVGQMALLHRLRWEAGGASSADAIADIERLANQALAITPRCSRAWSALHWGEIIRPSADWRKLLEYALKAVSSGSQDSLAHTTLGAALSRSSNALALPAYLESRRLDPLYFYASVNAASALIRLGRPAETLALTDEALRVEPELPFGVNVKSMSLIRLGRKTDFVAWIEQHPKIFSDRPLSAYLLEVQGGETGKAADTLNRIVTKVSSTQTSSNVRREDSIGLIPILLEQEKTDVALQLLNRMTELGDVPAYDWLMSEPQFAAVRTNVRFTAIATRARAQFDELRAILEDARTRGEMPKYLEAPLAELMAKIAK